MLVDLHQQRTDFAKANRPIEIDASVQAVADVLARSRTEAA
jgi:threonine synthase